MRQRTCKGSCRSPKVTNRTFTYRKVPGRTLRWLEEPPLLEKVPVRTLRLSSGDWKNHHSIEWCLREPSIIVRWLDEPSLHWKVPTGTRFEIGSLEEPLVIAGVPGRTLKGNWQFGQPGPYFSICIYLNEWWYFQCFAIAPVESEGLPKFLNFYRGRNSVFFNASGWEVRKK